MASGKAIEAFLASPRSGVLTERAKTFGVPNGKIRFLTPHLERIVIPFSEEIRLATTSLSMVAGETRHQNVQLTSE